MSDTKTFNISDTNQLGEVLKIMMARESEVRTYTMDLAATIGQIAFGISLLTDNEPITKARLLALAEVIEQESPKNEAAQMIRRMLAGALSVAPPPSGPQPTRTLRLAWSNPEQPRR